MISRVTLEKNEAHQQFFKGHNYWNCLIKMIQTKYQYWLIVYWLYKGVRVMVFNAIFNNISVILWQSILVEETGELGENHRSAASNWQTLSHNVVSSTPSPKQDLNINGARWLISTTVPWLYKSRKMYMEWF